MQDESIKSVSSRPVYPPVEININAAYHLFITEPSASSKVGNLLQQTAAKTHQLIESDNIEELKLQLTELIGTLPLATSVYLAGRETYMWQVYAVLAELGFIKEQIEMLTPTDNSRTVFCCHCYTQTHQVAAAPFECEGCGLPLTVTDHFSKRLGSYFGFQVNAEAKDELPAAEAF